MGILTTFKAKAKKYMAEADERAEKRLARAKTQAEREREQAKIQRERLTTRKEVAEAKAALLKAETAKKKATKELREVGNGTFSGLASLLGVKKAKPVTRPKKRAVRKAVARRKRKPAKKTTKGKSFRIVFD